ncbi:MAG: methyltransferase domain-containing protein [Anaerolineae bacterium]
MNHHQFFDQAAAEWDALEVEETLIRLREIVAGLDIVPGAAVLDVGAGTGVLVPLLLEATGGEGRIMALDISGEMLRQAQAKGYPVEYVQGDAENLPLRDEAFDWAICNAVFPHFPHKLRALGEICRVLRSGGRLVICHTASRQAINEFHRSMGGVVAHDTIPDEGEMLRLLQEAGLVEAQVRDEPDCYLILARRN